ncbi:MAG TPA: molybdate ABC transporter substrate-binding protein, partial [Gemmatimonadales bacterium]|jgi:molybdate transport system substrate-binding protein|nr:molybdate ABC transporter substrate-binding protein [Gemmatimonadales bacterium]
MTRLLLLLTLLLPACRRGETRGGPNGRELTIFVASSLVPAFQDLADTLMQRDSSLLVRLNGAASPALVTQLQMGGSADLLATADQRWMREAQRKGLAGSADTFAVSSLALVISTRTGAAEFMRVPLNLASPGTKVALAAPEVPLGRYSRELLARMSHLAGYGPDFATRVENGAVSQDLSAASVLGKLRLGEADAGIIYRAQLLADTSGSLREMPVPGARDIVAHYLIAVARSATDTTDARTFLELLRSPKGKAVLTAHGFELPQDAPGP